MKKLLIPLFFCSAAFTYGSYSKISLMGRLGFSGIFRHAQYSAVIQAQKLPMYVNNRVVIRDFLPVQPSPHSAVARRGLELFTTKLFAPLKEFRDSFSRHRNSGDASQQVADILARLTRLDEKLDQALTSLARAEPPLKVSTAA